MKYTPWCNEDDLAEFDFAVAIATETDHAVVVVVDGDRIYTSGCFLEFAEEVENLPLVSRCAVFHRFPAFIFRTCGFLRERARFLFGSRPDFPIGNFLTRLSGKSSRATRRCSETIDQSSRIPRGINFTPVQLVRAPGFQPRDIAGRLSSALAQATSPPDKQSASPVGTECAGDHHESRFSRLAGTIQRTGSGVGSATTVPRGT